MVVSPLIALIQVLCWKYEADTKTLSCRCRLFLLFGQDFRTPIGQQWYQVIGKQKKLIRMSGCQEHDQERVLVSASYLVQGLVKWLNPGWEIPILTHKEVQKIGK